ncbi:MAG: protein kinase [Rubritalea sp.]|uniref:protein kinase domain-containing protein n=1 Tax=Rubritalea sp. TaxID=2109375 RepID=UPI003241C2BD
MRKERHQITRKIGSGGFGCVYQARDTHLDRDIAIKRLKTENYTNHIELKEQLLTEAKVLAGLRHPNIVSIYDVIETETGGDIIMELIEGVTLDKVVKEGNLDFQQFLFIATQLLSAMATAHEHSILHCDLKPCNIMLTELDRSNYQATVLDFGMSPSQDDTSSSKSGHQRIVGSIHFMAPEVIESNVNTEASDIYSIGCLFYYALTGEFAFTGDSSVVIMASHIRNDFIPIKEHLPNLPNSFCEWLESHIHYKQEDRIESCRESLNALLQLEGIDAIKSLSKISYDSHLNNSMLNSLAPITKATVKLSAKQQAEFDNSKRAKTVTPAQDMIPMSERVNQVRPQDMWYFSIDGKRKGPVQFSKICELIAEGFIRSNDPIYQYRIGEWTPAVQIPEFTEEFKMAQAMPPRPERKEQISLRNSQGIRAQGAAGITSQIRVTQDKKPPFPIEITVAVVLSCLVATFLFFQPRLWQGCLVVTSLLFLLASLILTRIRMIQCNPKWLIPAILLPVVSDFTFACLKPKHGAQNFLLLIFGVLLFLYSSNHRYPNDFLYEFHLEFTSKLLSQ